MSPRALGRLLAVWALATAALCAGVHHAFALAGRRSDRAPGPVVATVWVRGSVAARRVVARRGDRDPSLDAALAAEGATLRYEPVTAIGPAPAFDATLLALSLAPRVDGLVATLGDRTEYLTPDDLLAHQAYRHGLRLPVADVVVGVDLPMAYALLASRLDVSVEELRRRATLQRARFERPVPRAGEASTAELLGAAHAAATFLARGLDASGQFRFLVDGATNQTLPGYDWPRHAGATYFLAQAASRTRDEDLAAAALRAAGRLRAQMVACGARRCVADGPTADVGSSALATLAFVEIARNRMDPSYGKQVAELAAFLRAQQRPDGEFMPRYDRSAARPIDVQLLYYSGEAALALSRAHALLGDPGDLEAARRALKHLAGPAWSFFGSRYYFGEEHWTCSAMADLWERSPDGDALAFCMRWLAFWRALQLGPNETPYDADGAYGVGPVPVPALTPVASRCEAGLATLAVMRRAGIARETVVALETQMKRSLALLLRQQLRSSSADRAGLLADPDAVDGAFPASEVDWSLRIDFAQHGGMAALAGADAGGMGPAMDRESALPHAK